MLPRILALALAVLGTGLPHADAASLRDSVPHITMSGTASMQVVPDIAVLYLAVSNERTDAEAATQATSKAANDLVADIKAHGIDAKDIEATFTLQALVDTKSDDGRAIESKVRGYRAQEYVDVTVRDAKTAGSLARRFLATGANQLRSVSYFINKQKELSRSLDAVAFRDALAQAKSYTDAAGLELGRVLQIGDDPQAVSSDGEADLPARRRMAEGPVSVPLEPGTQTLSQTITVTWEIKNAAH